MRRREFLQRATYWTAAGLAGPAVGLAQRDRWSPGDLVHLLPTVNDRRILIKFSLRSPLSRPPRLRIGSRAFAGESTDTWGLSWAVDATDLEPATRYELALEDDRGNAAKRSSSPDDSIAPLRSSGRPTKRCSSGSSDPR